jgi:hypothetical protein
MIVTRGFEWFCAECEEEWHCEQQWQQQQQAALTSTLVARVEQLEAAARRRRLRLEQTEATIAALEQAFANREQLRSEQAPEPEGIIKAVGNAPEPDAEAEAEPEPEQVPELELEQFEF